MSGSAGFDWLSADLTGRGLYLSDLHAGRDAAVDRDLRAMLQDLATQRHTYDWICWGGDSFDFLAAGNTSALARTVWVLEAMQALASRGIRQFLIEGNHDFHLAFLAQLVPGLLIAPDGLRDDVRGLALVHGDWHTAGGLYGPMRHLFRSTWMRRALAVAPHGLVDRVATAWSRGSHSVRGGEPESEYLAFVAQRFRAAMAAEPGLKLWLSGHVHWPSEVRQASAHCFINGEWAVHRTVIALDGASSVRYLCWTANGWAPYEPDLVQL